MFNEKAGKWLGIAERKDKSMLDEKMKSVKMKLEKVNPDYIHTLERRCLKSHH